MKFIRYSAYLNAIMQSWVQISFRFQTFASLCLYVWLGNILTPEKVPISITIHYSLSLEGC